MAENTLVHMKPFDPVKAEEDVEAGWYLWKQQADWHLDSLNITDKRKVARLMAWGGIHVQNALSANSTEEEWKLLKGTTTESKEKRNQEDEEGGENRVKKQKTNLLELAYKILNKAFGGTSNKVSKIILFRKTIQKPEESIREYYRKLTLMAENCEFDEDRKKDEIKSQFIIGVKSENFKTKMIAEALLEKSLEELLEIGYNLEMAERQANKGKKEESLNAIAIGEKKLIPFKPDCDKCGYQNHEITKRPCKALGSRCNKCNGLNHFARVCTNNTNTVFQGLYRGRGGRGRGFARGGARGRFNQTFRESYAPQNNYQRPYESPYYDRRANESSFQQRYDFPSRRNENEINTDRRLGAMEEMMMKVSRSVEDLSRQRGRYAKTANAQNETYGEYKRRQQIMAISNESNEAQEQQDEHYEVESVHFVGPQDKLEKVLIGSVEVDMMLDSGCQRNLIPEETYAKMIKNGLKIVEIKKDSDVKFKAYGANDYLNVRLKFKADLFFNGIKTRPWFYVVESGDLNLLGKISAIEHEAMNVGLTKEGAQADRQRFNKIKGPDVHISVRKDVKPIIQARRTIPLHHEDAIKRILEDLEQKDIIEPVDEPTEWISNMVVASKKDGSLRICLDMRDVNKAIERELHPMPTFEKIATMLDGMTTFSIMDVKDAFLQLELDENSRKLTTFYAPNGLYRYKRMLFGISIAPEAFQKRMESILAKLPGCINYIDDILVFGKNEKEHNENLDRVMKRLKEFNVMLKDSKCAYNEAEVEFLGHKFSAKGYEMTTDKLKAIKQLRAPTRKDELSAFLGLTSYLARFVNDYATISKPLRSLVHDKALKTKSSPLKWKEEHELAFLKIKEEILKGIKLTPFSQNKEMETILIVDASPVALGGILIQRETDKKGRDNDKIITFLSKTLTKPETNYCHTEKEALAIVWGIERLQFFLKGTTFTVITDHKALETLYNKTPKTCPRIERWIMRIQEYDFIVRFAPGTQNIADPFSRLISCMEENGRNEPTVDEEYVFRVEDFNILEGTVTIDEIKEALKDDVIGKMLCSAIRSNIWPKEIKSFQGESFAFSEEDGLLLLEESIYIPESLRKRILKLAHEGHLGKNKSLSRVKGRVWWPKMTAQLINEIKECNMCMLTANQPRKFPSKMRKLPEEPWHSIAIDFKDTTSTKKILVIVDYYSRMIDLQIQNSTSFQDTATSLLATFSYFGVAKTVTSDNGPPFQSKDFENFSKRLGFIHYTSPPLQPKTNGLAESAMKAIGKSLKISKEQKSNWEHDLMYKYLPNYRDATIESTGKSPHELMFGRRMQTKIPEIRKQKLIDYDKVRQKDNMSKEKVKQRMDKVRHAIDSRIKENDLVIVWNKNAQKFDLNYGRNVYKVMKRVGGDCLLESVDNPGQTLRRSIEHIKKVNKRPFEEEEGIQESEENIDSTIARGNEENEIEDEGNLDESVGENRGEIDNTAEEPRKSKRQRRMNPKFDDYVVCIPEMSDFIQVLNA